MHWMDIVVPAIIGFAGAKIDGHPLGPCFFIMLFGWLAIRSLIIVRSSNDQV
jgi:hypothetical protein